MSPEQAQQAGCAFAKAHLDVIEATYGPDIACAYANGHAWAARDYIYGLKGAVAAFDAMNELAEGAIVPVLPR